MVSARTIRNIRQLIRECKDEYLEDEWLHNPYRQVVDEYGVFEELGLKES